MSLPEELTRFFNDLKTQASSSHSAVCVPGVLRRKWQVPSSTPSGSHPEASHIQAPLVIAIGVAREQLNQLYSDALQTGGDANGGRAGELIAYKMAIDYLASYERALHGSLAAKSRCMLWSGSRRSGHGQGVGSLYEMIEQHITSTLLASRNADNEPTG